mgnify:CR=1 FL=1
MLTTAYHILFSLFTIYVLIEAISYAKFEITMQNNKFGGVCVMAFSLFCIILGNVVAWTT